LSVLFHVNIACGFILILNFLLGILFEYDILYVPFVTDTCFIVSFCGVLKMDINSLSVCVLVICM